MCIITKTRLGLKKTYNLGPRDIKLTGRSCKGISIYNLLKIPKSEEIIEILDAKDRRKAGMTASAEGLYLKDVFY